MDHPAAKALLGRLHAAQDAMYAGGDDCVAVLTDGTATLGGVEHRWSTVGLYRLAEARIAACWLLALDQAEFDRVWSSASDPGR